MKAARKNKSWRTEFHSPKGANAFGLLLILAFSIFLASRCANPVAPTGGPVDKEPPIVDTTKSTPNLSTNFNDDKITLVFDEWVQLNDAFNQIVVSPPMNEAPEVKLTRKKGVQITFREALRPNTTYTVNFGDAIRDITQNNTAENLKFIFSTGDFIDSLSTEGNVVDALTGAAVEGILVMMYENGYDSIVYKERPLYFAKTDKAGRFRIDYMKSGSFKVFALKDNNYNYLYDLPDEMIGFSSTELIITDSSINRVKLKAFIGQLPVRILTRDTSKYGQIRVVFNQHPGELEYQVAPGGLTFLSAQEDEEYRLWYDQPRMDAVILGLSANGIRDTITVRMPDKAGFFANNPKIVRIKKPEKAATGQKASPTGRPASGRSASTSPPANTGSSGNNQRGSTPSDASFLATPLEVHPDLPAKVFFNHPISRIDSTRILILEDTLQIPVVPEKLSLISSNRELQIIYPWKEKLRYQILIPAEALEDMYGLTNDTIRVKLSIPERKDFGSISSVVEKLDSTANYVIELIDSKNVVHDKYQVSGRSRVSKLYKYLKPGNYQLRVTEDLNANSRWDTGNYQEKRQPEQISLKSLPPLRPNWEVEAIISMDGSSPAIPGGPGQ